LLDGSDSELEAVSEFLCCGVVYEGGICMVASMVSLSWWHSDSVCWDNFCHGKVPGLGCCRVMAAVMQTIVPQSLVFGWFISLMVDQVSFGCASGVHSSSARSFLGKIGCFCALSM